MGELINNPVTRTEQSWEEFFYWLSHDMVVDTDMMTQQDADMLAWLVISASKDPAFGPWKEAADKSKAAICGGKK